MPTSGSLVIVCVACGHTRAALGALRSRGLDVPNKITPQVLVPLLPRLKCGACGAKNVSYRAAATKSLAKYVATAQSLERVFHRRSCGWMRHVTSESEISFPSRDAALARGFTPCKSCRP